VDGKLSTELHRVPLLGTPLGSRQGYRPSRALSTTLAFNSDCIVTRTFSLSNQGHPKFTIFSGFFACDFVGGTAHFIGSLGFEDSDAKTFASWGADYLKYVYDVFDQN